MEKAIPLKPSDKLAKVYQSLNSEDRILSLLPIKDDQTFHLKYSKKKTTEKIKQDANMPKKPVLGFFVAKLFSPRLILFKNLCK